MKYKGFESEKDYWKVLELAVEKAWTGIVIANKEGNFIYTNEIYQDLTGINMEALETISAAKLTEKLIKGKVSSSIEVFQKKKEIIMEQHILTTGRDVMIKANPVFGDDGEVEYAVTNILDVTKLQMLKNELKKMYDERKPANQKESEEGSLLDMWKEERTILYCSKAMEHVMRLVESVAGSDATALISGESGTGKELFARRIHSLSERASEPFLAINCSAIPESLLESELFGYESGTFTGGNAKGKAGILESAGGGTVFLDEIGDTPLSLQAKLLRVLEEKEVTRLGGSRTVKINARFIAATNLDLSKAVAERKFREDLFYRLNVLPLLIPPLRERREDIPILVNYYLSRLNQKYKKKKTITDDAINLLLRKPFYGNVRQLINLLERAVLVTAENDTLTAELVGGLYSQGDNTGALQASAEQRAEIEFGEDKTYKELLESFEEKLLRHYTALYGNSYRVAEVLHVNQSTVFRKLKKYQIK